MLLTTNNYISPVHHVKVGETIRFKSRLSRITYSIAITQLKVGVVSGMSTPLLPQPRPTFNQTVMSKIMIVLTAPEYACDY